MMDDGSHVHGDPIFMIYHDILRRGACNGMKGMRTMQRACVMQYTLRTHTMCTYHVLSSLLYGIILMTPP